MAGRSVEAIEKTAMTGEKRLAPPWRRPRQTVFVLVTMVDMSGSLISRGRTSDLDEKISNLDDEKDLKA